MSTKKTQGGSEPERKLPKASEIPYPVIWTIIEGPDGHALIQFMWHVKDEGWHRGWTYHDKGKDVEFQSFLWKRRNKDFDNSGHSQQDPWGLESGHVHVTAKEFARHRARLNKHYEYANE